MRTLLKKLVRPSFKGEGESPNAGVRGGKGGRRGENDKKKAPSGGNLRVSKDNLVGRLMRGNEF